MTYEQRKDAVAELNKHCAPERWAHLALSVVCAVGILILAFTVLSRNLDWKTATTMFGPAGIIVASQGRVLTLWNQIASILMGTFK